MTREKRIVDYKMVWGQRPNIMEEEVNKLLMQGWELYYGPCGSDFFVQALVKYQAVKKGRKQ